MSRLAYIAGLLDDVHGAHSQNPRAIDNAAQTTLRHRRVGVGRSRDQFSTVSASQPVEVSYE